MACNPSLPGFLRVCAPDRQLSQQETCQTLIMNFNNQNVFLWPQINIETNYCEWPSSLNIQHPKSCLNWICSVCLDHAAVLMQRAGLQCDRVWLVFVEHDCTHKGGSALGACIHKCTSCEHSGICAMFSASDSGFIFWICLAYCTMSGLFFCRSDHDDSHMMSACTFNVYVNYKCGQKNVIKKGTLSQGSYLYRCIVRLYVDTCVYTLF